jgi:hypothetical protein
MKKLFLPLLLWAFLGLASATVTPAQKAEQHKATHSIVMINEKAREGAGCSATAISEHVLLTAEHCNVASAVLYLDQNQRPFQHPLEVSERYFDHQDHMLIVLPGVSFKNTVAYGSGAPFKQGDYYYMWGNPGMIRNQYREGYVTGTVINPLNDDEEIDAVSSFLMLNGPVVGGDSGSALFSKEDGHIAGVLTYGIQYGMFAGTYPLMFTPEQIAQAEGLGTFVYVQDTKSVIPVVPVVNVNVNASAPTDTAQLELLKEIELTLLLIPLLFALPLLYKAIKALVQGIRYTAGPVSKAAKYVGRLFKTLYQTLKKI